MKSPAEKIVCLTLDKRLAAGLVTIDIELLTYGWKIEKFLVGNGTLFNKNEYSYIDEDVPEGGRRQAFNYYKCIQKIILQSKQEGISSLLYLEDDAILTKKFARLYPIIMKELDESNEFWDLFFLGGNHLNGVNKQILPHIIKPSYSLDYQSVIFNHTIFDLILGLTPNAYATFDGVMGEYQRKGIINALAASPSIITQKDGWSENEGRIVSRGVNHDI